MFVSLATGLSRWITCIIIIKRLLKKKQLKNISSHSKTTISNCMTDKEAKWILVRKLLPEMDPNEVSVKVAVRVSLLVWPIR